MATGETEMCPEHTQAVQPLPEVGNPRRLRTWTRSVLHKFGKVLRHKVAPVALDGLVSSVGVTCMSSSSLRCGGDRALPQEASSQYSS